MSSGDAAPLRKVSLLLNSLDKNAEAEAVIRRYAAKHATMDIAVGALSLLPGAAIPALLASIALQNKVIYQPMAKEVAGVYLRDTDHYTSKLADVASVATVGLEFAQEFGIEFLTEMAQDLVVDAGLGSLATMIPFAGAAVAAGLDYLIAQMMTWRVGTMTSIYFQNGAEWVVDRESTMKKAKRLTGGLQVSISELLSSKAKAKKVRVDFDDIPRSVSEVKDSGVRSVLPLLKGIADKLPRAAVRESLLAMGISVIIVDAALEAYHSQPAGA